MAKSAGFLKKLKKIGNLIGKGASWVNNNIVKPLKPIINQGVSFAAGAAGVPMVGTAINSAIDAGSKWLDDNYGTESNKQIQEITKYGGDILLDTQRSKDDRRYLKYGGIPDPIYGDEIISLRPKKSYSNPFGNRIN